MTKELSGAELQQSIFRCNRCGTCQDVCPTYKITGNESDVARSRLRLARLVTEGKYTWGEESELCDHIKSCLLCKACVTNCPSSVPTDQIMIQARNEMNREKGMPLFNRIAYRGVFSHGGRLNVLSKLIRIYQNSFAQSLMRKSGFLNLLKNYGKAEALLPPIPEKNLKARLPGILQNIQNPQKHVVYFTGCAINAFYSRFGEATIQVLQRNRCKVEVPTVYCCGGPHLSGGDFEEARRLAKQNIDTVLAIEPDAVITDCATCSGIMKEYGSLFENDPPYAEKARRFSALIRDVNEYILELDFVLPEKRIDAAVTIHDPCHLGRGQNLANPPREIVQSIPGLKLIEMNDADLCCGGAGSYGAINPGMSRDILARKMTAFQASKARYLVTSCPACAMQLEFGLRHHKLAGEVVHPIELLCKSYGITLQDGPVR